MKFSGKWSISSPGRSMEYPWKRSPKDTLIQLIELIKEHTTEIMVNHTVNGFHVVCKPFNYTTLQLPEKVELKTKCMTLLYFNGVSEIAID